MAKRSSPGPTGGSLHDEYYKLIENIKRFQDEHILETVVEHSVCQLIRSLKKHDNYNYDMKDITTIQYMQEVRVELDTIINHFPGVYSNSVYTCITMILLRSLYTEEINWCQFGMYFCCVADRPVFPEIADMFPATVYYLHRPFIIRIFRYSCDSVFNAAVYTAIEYICGKEYANQFIRDIPWTVFMAFANHCRTSDIARTYFIEIATLLQNWHY